MQRWTRFLAPPFLSLLCWPVAAQNIPARERGLIADAPYDYGQIDNVNLFNGNLTVSLPLGQEYKVDGLLSYALRLHYNSNVWEFSYVGTAVDSTPLDSTWMFGNTNAGIGWRLSLGRMLPPNFGPLNPSPEWMVMHPHGGRSRFYPNLHDSDPWSIHGYTRDGTYLRWLNDNGVPNTFDVENPSGITHRYSDSTGDLLRIQDRWGNYLDVGYPNSSTQTLTDQHGRTHYIYFRTSGPGTGMVDRVDLQAFGGARAVYTFNYQNVTVPRYRDTYHSPGSTVTIKLLTSITLPDGSSFAMSYFTQEVQPHAGNGWTLEVPGMISSLTLPTRGKYEWRYKAYQFTNVGNAPYGGDNEGVVSRKMIDENGVLLGEWTYTQVRNAPLNQTTTTVRTPLGDEAVHYFFDYDTQWQHGVPFTTAVNDAGSPPRYLSTKVFDGSAASGTLLRTEYVRYTADLNTSPALNTRLERAKTVYNDDSNRETSVTFSEFDGLGHYRRQVTASTLPDTSSRDVFTDFNPNQYSYEYDANLGIFLPGHSFQMLADTQPWVLNTFPSQRVAENGLIGAVSTFCFDGWTGSLKRSRVQKNTQLPSNQDLVANYTYGNGNVTREEYFGGDKETNSLSWDCNTSYPSSWSQYRIDHTYQYGSLKTSEYKTAGGGSMSFKHVDQDLDLSTGRVTTSRDTAGLATTLSYNNMGRLTQVQPPGQAATTLTYIPADAFTLARVKRLTGTDVEAWNHYDAFGRPWKERGVRENGQFSAREILYDANGWKASVSEWMNDGGPLTSKTQFLNYDPFGRPGIVRPPDGSQHDVTFSYTGDSQVARTMQVGTGRNGSAIVYTPATTTERYNGLGQLARVIEPNGTETKYTYNLHGQLSKVEMDIGGTPQVREFNYDKRGLLTSERHPEKGVSGNGYANLYDYDARGHAGRLNDGAHDLTLTYDRAERLLQIKETSGQQRVLKLFEYATTNSGSDYRKGRLWKATRHNYLEPRLPGQTISVTETYAYGSQSKPSSRTTTLSSGESFSIGLAFDTLGNLQTLTYPACTHAQCTDDNPVPPRNQTFTYTRGHLTAIPEFASSISYNTNLTVGQVAHANGQVVTNQLDPNGMRRPYRIDFNATGTQGVGPFSYDGAGNVAKIGSEDYLYDALSRVTQATISGGAWQSYTFDKFCNITQITTNGTPQPINVSATTNRLTGFQYDGAGNQLHYIQGTANLNLAYDAFNMINNVQGGTTDLVHVYTADNERILSFPATGTTSEWTLRGFGNELLRVYNEAGSGGTAVLES